LLWKYVDIVIKVEKCKYEGLSINEIAYFINGIDNLFSNLAHVFHGNIIIFWHKPGLY